MFQENQVLVSNQVVLPTEAEIKEARIRQERDDAYQMSKLPPIIKTEAVARGWTPIDSKFTKDGILFFKCREQKHQTAPTNFHALGYDKNNSRFHVIENVHP